MKEAGAGRDGITARGSQQQPNPMVTYEIPEESILSGSWGLAAISGKLAMQGHVMLVSALPYFEFYGESNELAGVL
ncbi:uncharacterized protein N7473_003733 [Penicillium subrubescens]|uniref:uncharacterized protein n=1 Tax=Penicillium subrubescens TaxID=1316194 RepID=UPI002545AB50|nr:uncharacterized protein N7473_003733 [Penicillium subrubescens]KAJ5906817.1 hypothetical protein N7473_003733 [Penicillium subrubescens]